MKMMEIIIKGQENMRKAQENMRKGQEDMGNKIDKIQENV